jgi:hypothetical protein
MGRGQYNHLFGFKPKLISIDYYPLWECYVKRDHCLCKKLEDGIYRLLCRLRFV